MGESAMVKRTAMESGLNFGNYILNAPNSLYP